MQKKIQTKISLYNVFKYVSLFFLFSSLFTAIFVVYNHIDPVKNNMITPDVPLAVYSDPEMKNMTRMILKAEQSYPVFAEKEIIFNEREVTRYPHFIRKTKIYALNQEGTLWATLNMARLPLKKEKGIWWPVPVFAKNFYFLLLCFLLLASGFFIFSKYISAESENKKITLFCFGFFNLWSALLMFTFFLHDFYMIHSVDYQMYFSKAENWMAFDKFPPISVSVGLSFLYIPFILLGGISSVSALILPFSIFSFIVFGGGGLILIILIARSLWKTSTAQTAVAILACCYPFLIWIIRKGGVHQKGFIAKSQLFITPGEHPFSMVIFNKSLLFSWNALSHNAESFFILLGFFCLFKLKREWKKYIILGFLFGFAITIRYSALAVLPAVFFIDLVTMQQEKEYRGNILFFYAIFALTGLMAVSPQLLDNFMSNGSILTPSVDKSLYRQASSGLSGLFGISNLIDGIHFYIIGHYKAFLLSALCLLFLKDRKKSMFLWLWGMGILLFYSSMNFYGTSIMRYMVTIYPVFYLIWSGSVSNLKRQDLIITTCFILLNFIIPSPGWCHYNKPIDLPVIIHFITPLISILAVIILYFYKQIISRETCIFVSLFLMLMLIGSWIITLILLCVCPILSVIQYISQRKYLQE